MTADNKLLLTCEEAGERIGCGRTMVFALIKSGDLESVQIGRLRLVPVDALVDYVKRLRKQAKR